MAHRTITQDQLVTEARAAFGDEPEAWAFRCPNCGDVAVARDFREAGADTARLGQECVGRSLGALTGTPTTDAGKSIASRGCDWTAYGLFHGPWFIEMTDGKRVPCFALAT